MRIFVISIVISLIVHFCVFAIPLPKRDLEKKEIIPVSVVDYKELKIKKMQLKKKQVAKTPTKTPATIKPSPKKEVKKAEISANQKNQQASQSNNQKTSNAFRPKGADDPLILPDMNVPTIADTIPEISVPMPELGDRTGSAGGNNRNIDISEELAALNSDRQQRQATNSNNVSQEVKKEENNRQLGTGRIANFDMAPSGDRKVISLPPDPVFSLTNDTKVTVRFDIDKSGNTYNITFITRSSADVEKLARDYISRMKFDAILENRVDFAQITMEFKVQK